MPQSIQTIMSISISSLLFKIKYPIDYRLTNLLQITYVVTVLLLVINSIILNMKITEFNLCQSKCNDEAWEAETITQR